VFSDHEQNGQKSRFAPAAKSAGLPEDLGAGHTRHVIKKTNGSQRSAGRAGQANTGADEVTSFSYLPATFTTLFFLAAALLLGLIQ
jgi:hypothetical protein